MFKPVFLTFSFRWAPHWTTSQRRTKTARWLSTARSTSAATMSGDQINSKLKLNWFFILTTLHWLLKAWSYVDEVHEWLRLNANLNRSRHIGKTVKVSDTILYSYNCIFNFYFLSLFRYLMLPDNMKDHPILKLFQKPVPAQTPSMSGDRRDSDRGPPSRSGDRRDSYRGPPPRSGDRRDSDRGPPSRSGDRRDSDRGFGGGNRGDRSSFGDRRTSGGYGHHDRRWRRK